MDAQGAFSLSRLYPLCCPITPRRTIQHEDLPPALPAPPPEAPMEDVGPARPAWRTVHRREERRAKAKAKALPAPAPPPAIAAPPEASHLPAWAQWKRPFTILLSHLSCHAHTTAANPLLSPVPIMGTSAAPLPADIPMPRAGLFGASSRSVLTSFEHSVLIISRSVRAAGPPTPPAK